MTTHNIDYIKFKTTKPFINFQTIEPAQGYHTHMSATEYGIMRWGHHKSEKYQCEMQGTHLRRWQDDMSQLELLEMILSSGAEITRLDMAATTNLCTPEEFWDIADSGVGALCRQNVVKTVVSKAHGVETCYIGDRAARGRKGVFRCYNYSLAHGLENFLTRFELECGSNNAQGAAKKIMKSESIRATINTYIDYPNWGLWREIMGPNIEIRIDRGHTVERDESMQVAERWHWLNSQVAKALGETIARDALLGNDHTNWHGFMANVREAHDEYIKINGPQPIDNAEL